MFEKEAEEMAEAWLNERYLKGMGVRKPCKKAYKTGFQDGYNKAFVEADKNLKAIVTDFNKANEWHYVKDGEHPTHSNRVLVFTDEGVGFGIYGLDNKKWYTYDTGFDVIAWKEITLPALPKEIEE